MKKSKKIILIAIAALFLLILIVGIIWGCLAFSHPKKTTINPGSYVQKVYQMDNGKRRLIETNEYYMDPNGRLEYAYITDEKTGETKVFEREYDTLGRLVSEKRTIRRRIGVSSGSETSTYQYYMDTDKITEEQDTDESGNLLYSYRYTYDDEGRQLTIDHYDGEDGTNSRSEYRYNERGIKIYANETYNGQSVIEVDYDPATRTLKTSDCEFILTPDGRYESGKGVSWGGHEGDIEFNYYPEDDPLDYEEITRDENGEILLRRTFDKQGRVVKLTEYSKGQIIYDSVTDYNAEDPDFPGEVVSITKINKIDDNGNLVPESEVRTGMFSPSLSGEKQLYGGKDKNIYYWYRNMGGQMKPYLQYTFYEDGTVRSMIGNTERADYDEHGGWTVRNASEYIDDPAIHEYEAEYTYYD